MYNLVPYICIVARDTYNCCYWPCLEYQIGVYASLSGFLKIIIWYIAGTKLWQLWISSWQYKPFISIVVRLFQNYIPDVVLHQLRWHYKWFLMLTHFSIFFWWSRINGCFRRRLNLRRRRNLVPDFKSEATAVWSHHFTQIDGKVKRANKNQKWSSGFNCCFTNFEFP